MTRKDFELIEEVLRRTKPEQSVNFPEGAKWGEVVWAFSNALVKTNPRFDGERFRKACGMEE